MSNYRDVWQTLIADKQKSWVLFEAGTCVVLPQPDNDLGEQAKAVLAPYAGTSMGDFRFCCWKTLAAGLSGQITLIS